MISLSSRIPLLALTILVVLSALLVAGGIASSASNPLQSGWQHVEMSPRDAENGGPIPTKVIPTGPGSGLVALGSGYGLTRLVWTSPDGHTWSRLPIDPQSPTDGIHAVDITTGGPGLVAVGGKTELKTGEMPYAAVWTSVNGQTWTRIPDGPVFAGAAMSLVVAGGPGLVALGTDYASVSGATGYRVRPVVWTSPDGIAWTREELTDPSFQNAQIVDVVKLPDQSASGSSDQSASGSGQSASSSGQQASSSAGLLAMGAAAPFPATPRPAAWTSTDGKVWTPVSLDPTVFPANATIYRLTVGPHGVLALGGITDPGGVVRFVTWVSPDGHSWTMSGPDPFAQGTVREISTAGGQYVAIGERETDPALWSSTDGLNWTRDVGAEVFTGGSVVLTAMAPRADGLVVVGSVGSGSAGSTPTAWLWSPKAAASATPIPTPGPVRTDPKSLRLRLDELPPGFHLDAEGAASICDLAGGPDPKGRCARIRKAMGSYHAYSFQFSNLSPSSSQPTFVEGWIVVVHNSAAAKRIFTIGPSLANELARAFYFNHDKRLTTQTKIGQQTLIYKHSINRLNKVQNAYSVLWRDGRDIGEIVTGGLPQTAAVKSALKYAAILHAHYKEATSG